MYIEHVTAEQAAKDQRRAAGWLLRMGIGAGERIALHVTPSADYLGMIGGALRAGVVPVPLAPNQASHEADRIVEDARVRIVLSCADQHEAVNSTGGVDLPDAPLTRPMLYTSGTTGRRKGVYVAPWSEAQALAAFDDENEQWGFSSTDVHVVCSPLYHSAPLRFALHTLWAGGTVVVPASFEPRTAAGLLADEGVSTTFMAPAHIQRLADIGGLRPGRLRLLAHAGAPCRPPLKRTLHDKVGVDRVWEFYGSTEAQFTACPGNEWHGRPGTVGRARAGRTLRIDNGVIWCRQPAYGRFVYWNDPDKTAAAWRDGWCTVGDLGRLDDDRYLFLEGRREDLIISGGVNVYPTEVEQALGDVPGIGELAVVGIDDDMWGQAVWVAYTGDVDEDLLAEVARRRLTPANRPKGYSKLEALPLTPTGKVSRPLLRKLLDG